MDIDLARTFLAIVEARSFMRAADMLNISQTAVSARVRTLERLLGRQLFVRNRAGISLTAAGKHFLDYAPGFVHLWERAKQQVAVPTGHRAVLAVGIEATAWGPWLNEWLSWMKKSIPDVALRLRLGWRDELTGAAADGLLDLAVVYAPTLRPGLSAEVLLEETLVLVERDGPQGHDFIDIDWGGQIARMIEPVAAVKQNPALSFNFGPAALSYLLSAGGRGYFRRSIVAPHLRMAEVRLVEGAPELPYPVYAVHPASPGEVVVDALAGLRAVASTAQA